MEKTRRKNAQFVHIGEIVEKVLSSCRYEPDSRLSKIYDIWQRAVGPDISKNAKPAAVKGGLLLVHVSSAAWVHQLRYLKDQMITRVNGEMGSNGIRDIKFKIGPL